VKTSGEFQVPASNSSGNLIINQQQTTKPSLEEIKMADQASATPPHRLKMDGSSDSICLNCLATVSAKQEADQSGVELPHICLPSFSARRSAALQQSV
jgi:hypothetical protein